VQDHDDPCDFGSWPGGLRLTPPGWQSKRVAIRKSAAERAAAVFCQPMEPLVDASLREYLPILILLAVAVGLGLVLILAAAVLAVRNPDPEKVSAYECGFNAFDDARMKFDVRFYLVSILFIIFDLEVAFLFPWAVAFKDVSMMGFWSMMVFLGVLTVGFAYEWKKGALEWE
jgi:NADH-quinone oxidoreductase subunit A